MDVNMYDWEENIKKKIKNKEQVDLLKDLPIKKDLWLKNFVKSATSTTLIGLAFNFIFDGIHKHPHDNNEILLGVVAFLIAMLVIFIIDEYHQKVRELELRSINANLNLQGNGMQPVQPLQSNYNEYLINKNYIDEKVEEYIKEGNGMLPVQNLQPSNYNEYLINKKYIDEKVEEYIKEQLKKVLLEEDK